jgi:PAT family beta-lactamase induction signal transducer AmpG
MNSSIFSRKMAVIFLLGFSSGLPLALTGSTLQAWMTDLKVDLSTIGLFALVGIPYALKFLWAPVMDRFFPPFMGRREGWIFLCQVALICTIAVMGLVNPSANPLMMAFAAFIVSFFSASQDIVVDAYRTEIVDKDELGPAASLNIAGYRIAMIVSGAGALILADKLTSDGSWRTVYFIMAAVMSVGALATLFAPKTNSQPQVPASLRDAFFHPFLEFFKRKGSLEILSFIILYKMDVVFATALMTPFMLQTGFTKTDIGVVTKGFGLIATIVGTLAGGALMVRLGMKKSLWTFGLIQGVSGLSFFLLAYLGKSYPMMVIAIAVENICSGMGTTAYSAFIMSLCNRKFAATQYAILTSLMALTRILGSAPTGYIAEAMGWKIYFIISVLIMIPGLLLLTRYSKWNDAEGKF